VHIIDFKGCEELGDQIELTECCILPIPKLQNEILKNCKNESQCEMYTCLDRNSKFRENGKLHASQILAEFRRELKHFNHSTDIWIPVIEKSIETCNGISESISASSNAPSELVFLQMASVILFRVTKAILLITYQRFLDVSYNKTSLTAHHQIV
jgi:hypothetical protein